MGIGSEDEILDIWPENWLVWDLWRELGKRWRVVSGLAGDRYQALDLAQAESLMRLRRITEDEQARLVEELLDMEDVAVAAIYAE